MSFLREKLKKSNQEATDASTVACYKSLQQVGPVFSCIFLSLFLLGHSLFKDKVYLLAKTLAECF